MAKTRIISVTFFGDSDAAHFSVDNDPQNIQTIKTFNCLKKPEKCLEFLKQITSKIPATKIKAMVFLIAEIQDSFKRQQTVKEKFREFCKNHEILYHFPSMENAILNGILLNTKPKLIHGEFLAIVMASDTVSLRILHYTSDVGDKCFRFIEFTKFPITKLESNKKILMQKYNLKYLIFFSPSCENGCYNLNEKRIRDYIQKIEKCFSLNNLKIEICDNSFKAMFFDTSIKMIQNLMDKKEMEYFVKYFCTSDLNFGSIIKCKNGELLPIEKTVTHNVSDGSFITLREVGNGKIESFDLTEYNSKKVKITFKLDIDMFYSIEVEPHGPPIKSSSKMPETDKTVDVEKVKIVFTQNHFSIFIVKNGKKKVIKDSNGATKIPLCISFAEEIPIVGENAEDILKTQPTFVVYDLIKLCSKDSFQSKDPKWSFNLIKTSKGKILIEFDTSDGRRRKKSPDIFIKIILIYCLELIGKESGKKFGEIGIEFEGLGSKEETMECFLKAAQKIDLQLKFL